MGKDTGINYVDSTWNPVMGCTPVSEACDHCYAREMMKRFAGRKGWPSNPSTVTTYPERLGIPLSWKSHRRIFTCSMSDLFHEDVPDEFIYQVFVTMTMARQHTFMVLTKRPERMYLWFYKHMTWGPDWITPNPKLEWASPLPNVWLGVTAENQRRVDERVPILLKIPAEKRFVSIEPILGSVNLGFDGRPGRGHPSYIDDIDLVIVGGETGNGARSLEVEWVRDLKNQCVDSGTSFFLKYWGGTRLRKGGHSILDGREWLEMPE